MSMWRRLFGGRTVEEGEPLLAPLRFPQVPAYHEVVFEELSVRVFAHDFFQDAASFPCWSYVTDGMRRHGQKEFVFTLKRRGEEAVEDYPHDPLRLFASIYSLATQGKKVEINEFTQFKLPGGFLDCNDLVAVAYIPSEKLPGVNYAENPLAAILFLRDEAELLPTLGSYRVLTRLGQAQSYYPTPPWSDRDRPRMLKKSEMGHSILGRVPVAYVPWGRVRLVLAEGEANSTAGDKLTLRLNATATHSLRDLLNQVPKHSPFAWILPPAEDADARLVWRPEMTGVEAIVPPDSRGAIQTGGYIAFIPNEEQPEGGQIFEDGFVLTLRRQTMAKLREALTRAERLDINPSPDRLRFALHWDYPERTGSAVEFGNGLLYQPESVLQERIADQQAFVNYVGQLQNILKKFIDLLPEARGQNLLFVAALRSGGQVRFWMDIQPDGFPAEWKEEIENRLRAVRVPEVRNGPVAYAMFGKLWGGSAIAGNSQSQMVPEEWRHAAVKLGSEGALNTDDILRVVWPG